MKKGSINLARDLHRNLPEGKRRELLSLGLLEKQVKRRLIGWNGAEYSVPVFEGEELVYLAYLTIGKKGAVSERVDTRTPATLYAADILRRLPRRVVVVEGVWNALVLEAHGFAAVGVTGTPRELAPRYRAPFQGIREVAIAFRPSGLGAREACHIASVIPQARILQLPSFAEEGAGAYFTRHGRGREDFRRLLSSLFFHAG